jgi:wyosine [tRNA(Phe)-imidazoG37] synthetase (radical SAM superfamily)
MLDGCTTTDAQVNAIAHHARRINPDRLQLNTATRPTAEADALAVSADRLQALAGRFDPPAEIVADYRNVHQQSEHATSRDQVLELLTRRPCSIDEIAEGLNAHRNEVIKHVAALQQHGRITSERRAGRRFFLPVPTPHHDSQQVPHE